MAQMLDAYRNYFRAIRESYLRPDASLASADRARGGGQAGTLEPGGVHRSPPAEPGTGAESLYLLGATLASSRRLTHAMMALEAGLARSRPAPARPAFRRLADPYRVDPVYLAAALRGSSIDVRNDLPDLREDHHTLVASAIPPANGMPRECETIASPTA
jgi:hypothetical protein